MVARSTDDEAWSAGRALFPEERVGRLKTAMRKQSQSDWIKRLAQLATEDGVYDEVYWTGAFRNDKGNMPVLVGSYRKGGRLPGALPPGAGGANGHCLDMNALLA